MTRFDILGFPVFRASAQGGDRYPKHGADQLDRVLPQNRRRPVRTGETGVRCPRRSSNPADQIAELPHKPETGAFGCGHRSRQRKKQGTDLMKSLFPAFLCPAFEMPFPAFNADNLSTAFPFLQTADGYSHFSCKRFLPHAEGFPVCPDAVSLSIIKEVVELIQKICHWHIVELCQPLHFLWFNMLCKTFFDSLVNTVRHSHLVRNLHLHQPLAVSTPAEPIRDTFNFFISAIPLIKLGGLQNLPWGAQYETVYV